MVYGCPPFTKKCFVVLLRNVINFSSKSHKIFSNYLPGNVSGSEEFPGTITFSSIIFSV